MFRAACLVAFLTVATSAAQAALNPERVFVVVNQRSWSSRSIANSYVKLHRVPQSNVFNIDWDGSVVSTSLAVFQKDILEPILAEINRRRLGTQIDCIVYSSDFPYAIDFSADVPRGDQDRFRSGSITGLTYLYEQLRDAKAVFRSPSSNWYASALAGPPEPFQAGTRWTVRGESGQAGRKYILSAMLGYVSGRGNSYEEVHRYLHRAALATAAKPRGTFYLTAHDNIRSKVRSPRFPSVVRSLKDLGFNAKVTSEIYPKRSQDILGVVLGHSHFKITGGRILSGAICENLTSFGGILDDSGSQLALTELLRRGAAGSSGAVIEPFAMPQKFPDPAMHAHYVQGLSLAESFYRSTRSPYQMLLVGDPLCCPWNTSVRVGVGLLEKDEPLSGTVAIRPSVAGEASIDRFELYIDGRLTSSCEVGQQFEVDTLQFPDGYHEFRVVAVLNSRVASKSRWLGWREVQNHGNWCRAEVAGQRLVSWGDRIGLKYSSSQPMTFHLFYQRRQLSLPAQSDSALIDTEQLGFGPNSLQVVGLTPGGAKVFAEPLTVFVRPPRKFQAIMRHQGTPITLVKVDGAQAPFDSRKPDWLKSSGIKNGQTFHISGDIEAKTEGLHQFQALFAGRLSIHVDSSKVFEAWHPKLQREELPVHLAKGYHSLRISCTPADVSVCELRFGYRGARKLRTPDPPKPKPIP